MPGEEPGRPFVLRVDAVSPRVRWVDLRHGVTLAQDADQRGVSQRHLPVAGSLEKPLIFIDEAPYMNVRTGLRTRRPGG